MVFKYLLYENLKFNLQLKFRYKNFFIYKYFRQLYVKNHFKLRLVLYWNKINHENKNGSLRHCHLSVISSTYAVPYRNHFVQIFEIFYSGSFQFKRTIL
jgi:hypothetical protein